MKREVKVIKFGGSSVRDAERIFNAVKIITQERPQVVVISATAGTTNTLEQIYHELRHYHVGQAQQLIHQVIERHQSLARQLELQGQWEQIFSEWKKDFLHEIDKVEQGRHPKLNQLYSYGERLSSAIVQLALAKEQACQYLWAPNFIHLDNRGLVDNKKLRTLFSEACYRAMEAGETLVTQGFLATSSRGELATLGREGSDFTATLLAEACEASECQIWTDVDGFFFADPRLTDRPFKLDKVSYATAKLLAQKGAKILHPKTLDPLIRAGSKLVIKNSMRPEVAGTTVSQGTMRKFEGAAVEKVLSPRQKTYLDEWIQWGEHDIVINLVGQDIQSNNLLQSQVLGAIDPISFRGTVSEKNCWSLLLAEIDQDGLANCLKVLQNIAENYQSL